MSNIREDTTNEITKGEKKSNRLHQDKY